MVFEGDPPAPVSFVTGTSADDGQGPLPTVLTEAMDPKGPSGHGLAPLRVVSPRQKTQLEQTEKSDAQAVTMSC